jgi:hypothetical protein
MLPQRHAETGDILSPGTNLESLSPTPGWLKRIARKLQQYTTRTTANIWTSLQALQCAAEKSTPGQDRTGDLQRVRLTS